MLCHFTTDKVRKSFHFWPLSFQPASCYLLGKVRKSHHVDISRKNGNNRCGRRPPTYTTLHDFAKKKCQLECWNLMDGVVYCPFFPFYKHHASVKEKSFCIGDVLQGPIFQIVHSCWRSIWIHLWPPSSRAPTKIISYHLYLLVVLTYLVEISLS